MADTTMNKDIDMMVNLFKAIRPFFASESCEDDKNDKHDKHVKEQKQFNQNQNQTCDNDNIGDLLQTIFGLVTDPKTDTCPFHREKPEKPQNVNDNLQHSRKSQPYSFMASQSSSFQPPQQSQPKQQPQQSQQSQPKQPPPPPPPPPRFMHKPRAQHQYDQFVFPPCHHHPSLPPRQKEQKEQTLKPFDDPEVFVQTHTKFMCEELVKQNKNLQTMLKEFTRM